MCKQSKHKMIEDIFNSFHGYNALGHREIVLLTKVNVSHRSHVLSHGLFPIASFYRGETFSQTDVLSRNPTMFAYEN